MITTKQAEVLRLIADSEYHDGADPVDHYTWIEVIMDYYNGSQKEFLGVLVSLQNAGMVRVHGAERRTRNGYGDGTCCITADGMTALNEYQPA